MYVAEGTIHVFTCNLGCGSEGSEKGVADQLDAHCHGWVVVPPVPRVGGGGASILGRRESGWYRKKMRPRVEQ